MRILAVCLVACGVCAALGGQAASNAQGPQTKAPFPKPPSEPARPASPPVKAPPVDTSQGLRTEPHAADKEQLTFAVEWRLIRAGVVTMETQKSGATVRLQSSGLVSALFKVDDNYRVNFEGDYCAAGSLMDAREGRRHGETRITFDGALRRADFEQRDLLTGQTIRRTSIDTPPCVGDVIAALQRMREHPVEVGKSVDLPLSDGRKAAMVKVEAQDHEEVKTPLRSYKTVRYEANMMNGVVYARPGRVFLWLTDDQRHLPVQIRVRMNFPVGTVTLQLEKEPGAGG